MVGASKLNYIQFYLDNFFNWLNIDNLNEEDIWKQIKITIKHHQEAVNIPKDQ